MSQVRIAVATIAELPLSITQENQIIEVSVGDKEFALSRVGTDYILFEPRCPHQGVQFCHKGIIREGVITCLLHGRQYDLSNGRCLRPAGIKPLQRHKLTEEAGVLYLELEPEQAGVTPES
jgi:nitrite reductase/ring-hydroxylating ferredoxin subunit